MTTAHLRPLLVVLCLLAAALAAPVARADSTAELSMEDNNVLFGANALPTARQWKAIGVDRVRVVARWNRIAPAAGSPTKPAGFNSASPTSPGYNWGELDSAVSILRAVGLKPQILIPNSGPLWASGSPSLGLPEYKPKVTEFSSFAQAVVRRYSPRGVRIYLLGNEANQNFFLKPQLECRGRKCTDFSPSHYRKMLVATYPRVKDIYLS
jgi:hypothetical protein